MDVAEMVMINKDATTAPMWPLCLKTTKCGLGPFEKLLDFFFENIAMKNLQASQKHNWYLWQLKPWWKTKQKNGYDRLRVEVWCKALLN